MRIKKRKCFVKRRFSFKLSKELDLNSGFTRVIMSLLFLLGLVLIPNHQIMADNNAINWKCPGEIIEEINGTIDSVSHTEEGSIGGGGNDRYRMTFQAPGVLQIDAINRIPRNNANYKFYVSRNNCGNNDSDWNIVSAEEGKEHHKTINVNTGDTIYIRLKAIGGGQSYSLNLDFQVVASSQACADATGLEGNYYNNPDFIEPVVLQKTDPNIDFDWGLGSPANEVNDNYFSIRWKGYILVPDDAHYIFSSAHNHDIKVIIDGNVVYNDTSPTSSVGSFRDGGTISLDKGCHNVEIEFREDITYAYAKLKWRNDVSIPTSQIISEDYFFHTPAFTCNGCDCSLDINVRNSYFPGIAIPELDGAMDNVTKCISGVSKDSEGTPTKYDYYHFKVETDGNLTITTSSPNNHDYHLEIKRNNSVLYPDTIAIDHQIPTIMLNSGDEITLKFKETGDDTDEYQATISFIKTSNIRPECSNPNTFKTRISTYIPGDLVAIGNSNICADVDPNNDSAKGDGICDTDQIRRNDIHNIIYVNKYSSPSLANIQGIDSFENVSSAILSLPADATVKWAGLYWQGSVWNFKKGSIINIYGNDSGDDGLEMMAKENRVIFKTPVTEYSEVIADEHHWVNLKRSNKYSISYGYGYGLNFGYDNAHEFNYHLNMRYERHYQGFKDVTQLLKDVESANGTANGEYWVGNIQSTLGKLMFPGVEASWSLVVIYERRNSQPRSISITDGYVALYNSAPEGGHYADEFGCPNDLNSTGIYYRSISFDINNISTPKKPGFTTDMMVFVTESDPEDTSDTEYLKITKKDGSDYLVDGNNSWNYEIKNKDGSDNLNRNPNYIYPIGMLIKNYHLTDALDTEQNSTTVTFSTDNDKLILGVIGFATDMKAPELCYDMDVRIGDYMKLNLGNNRFFRAIKLFDPLQVKVFVRSKDADFDFEKAKLYLRFTPDNNDTSIEYFDYREGESKISQGGTSLYESALEINKTIGEIAIGHNISDSGGTLYPEESTYVREYFDINNSFEGIIDVIVEGEVRYTNDMIVPYKLSTGVPEGTPGHIGRCETNPTYDPVWGKFNVENENSKFSDPDNVKYPLYTQVAGQPFKISVASYDIDPNKPEDDPHKYTLPKVTNASIELEVIDASVFDNNVSTGYDATCEEPSSLSRGLMIKFNNQDRIQINMNEYPGFYNLPVLRNATFRMWELYYHDSNGTLSPINYSCTSQSDSACFEQVYNTYYKNGDDNDTKYCETKCINSVVGTDCYDCLRNYFAKPVCSRDNFSIRPGVFHIKVADNNASSSSLSNVILENNSSLQYIDLSVGYPYVFDIEALDYNGTSLTKEYYTDFSKDYTPLRTQEASLKFNLLKTNSSSPDCNDTLKRGINYNQENFGILGGKTTIQLMGIDAGHYDLNLIDKDWTAVDQNDYNYQTKFNNQNHEDCFKDKADENSTDYSLSRYGCYVSSEVPASSPRVEFKRVGFYFMPYKFTVSDLNLSSQPTFNNKSFIYMNDLDKNSDVGALFEGKVTAIGKTGETLYNFTDHCAAKDIELNLNISIKKGNIVPNNPNSVYADDNVTEIKGKIFNFDNGMTRDSNDTFLISSSKFSSESNGTSDKIQLLYNLKKSYSVVVNATDVDFKSVEVKSIDAKSYADMTSSHIPEGNNTLNDDFWFMFAKVEKPNEINPTKYEKIYSESVDAVFYTDIYCRDDISTDINCSSYPFTNINTGITSNFGGWWYRSGEHQSSLGDGKILNFINTSELSSYLSTISRPSDVEFVNGTTDTITISYPRPKPRPQKTIIQIDPDEWLKYDPDVIKDGKPEFFIYFLETGFDWKGIGDTGNVVDNNKTSPVFNKRLSW